MNIKNIIRIIGQKIGIHIILLVLIILTYHDIYINILGRNKTVNIQNTINHIIHLKKFTIIIFLNF